jgi:hypothetical protein
MIERRTSVEFTIAANIPSEPGAYPQWDAFHREMEARLAS